MRDDDVQRLALLVERGGFTPFECFPEPHCRCCVCQGICCLMPHPGHFHGELRRLTETHVETILRRGRETA